MNLLEDFLWGVFSGVTGREFDVIREIDPASGREMALVAERMQETLAEVLGEARGREMYSREWLLERVRFHLDPAQSTAKIFLSESEVGVIAGHTIVRLDRDPVSGEEVGLFATIYVAPEFRGRGIAKRLVDAGENWLRSQLRNVLQTYTDEDNHRLIGLFRGCGFSLVARVESKRMVVLEKRSPVAGAGDHP